MARSSLLLLLPLGTLLLLIRSIDPVRSQSVIDFLDVDRTYRPDELIDLLRNNGDGLLHLNPLSVDQSTLIDRQSLDGGWNESRPSDQCLDDVYFYWRVRRAFDQSRRQIDDCPTDDVRCRRSIVDQLRSNSWTFRQTQTGGKIPRHFNLNSYWYGNYRECKAIDIARKDLQDRNYRGKYCFAMLSLNNIINETTRICPPFSDDTIDYDSTVHMAICVPDSCSSGDVLELLKHHPLLQDDICNVFCVEDEPRLNATGLAFIIMISVTAAILALATIVDYYYNSILITGNHKNGRVRYLMAFSLYTNGKRILDMTKQPGQFDCLHGIRVLSLFWVILGHNYEQLHHVDNEVEAMAATRHWLFELANNFTFCVDTFFVLSGFLVSYHWFRKAERVGGKNLTTWKAWWSYLAHRYVRLTPVYAAIIFARVALLPFLTQGPNQFGRQVESIKACTWSWWTNLLYMNNVIILGRQLCHETAWYMANEMQYYTLLAPLFLTLLLRRRKVACGLIAILLMACITVTAVTIVRENFPATLRMDWHYAWDELQPPQYRFGQEYFENFIGYLYISFWIRFAPYVIGILMGYLWQTSLCKRKQIGRRKATFIWLVMIAIGLSLTFGLADSSGGRHMQTELYRRTIYGSTARIAWSLFICWLIFACLSGIGGPINEMLSWGGWLPLSRLSYTVYLIHHMILDIINSSGDSPLHWSTHLLWMSKWISVVVLSVAVSFFFSCAYELSVLNVEKLIQDSSDCSARKEKAKTAIQSFKKQGMCLAEKYPLLVRPTKNRRLTM